MLTLTRRCLGALPLVLLCACGGGSGGDSTLAAAAQSPDQTSADAQQPQNSASAPAPGLPEVSVTPDTSTTAALDTSVAAAAAGLPTAPGGHRASVGNFAAADLQTTLAAGKAIWRAQRIDINGINKGACANCHSADGLELALWKFTDDDIRRRAHIDGVNDADRETLVKYFSGLRQQYKVTATKDVLWDRPFQPKGQPFAGTLAERDLQFATKTLAVVTPTLVSEVIDTLPEAIKAKEELRASNPLAMQIGIPMPRISEDCFRGSAHCSANDWMADTPRIPKDAMSAQWFALNDQYIADPSDANLRAVLAAVDTMTDVWKNPGPPSGTQAGVLGTEKFKSMQILQHFMRREQLGLFTPADDPNPLAPLKNASQLLKRPNFPFLVGDFAFDKNADKWTLPSEMPVFVRNSFGETAAKPLTKDDVTRLKQEMSTPWWYAGFMFDTALGTGTNREYFFGELGIGKTGGYPFHHYYVVGKHGADSKRKNTTSPQDSGNIAFSLPGWKVVGEADMPRLFTSIEARQLYRRMEANWTRMWMLLQKEQIRVAGLASLNDQPEIDLNICAASGGPSLRSWVAASIGFDPVHANTTLALYNELIGLAKCALAPLTSTYATGTGTGLRVEWFAGAGDEFNGKSSALSSKLGERIEPIIGFPGRETGSGYYAAWAKSIGVGIVEGSNSAFSARGTGFVTAPVTGEYEFYLRGGFGRLTVDGKELFSQFRFNEDNPVRVTIALQAGQRYPLVFERHGYAAGGMLLEWRTLDGKLPRQTVPTLQLSPS